MPDQGSKSVSEQSKSEARRKQDRGVAGALQKMLLRRNILNS